VRWELNIVSYERACALCSTMIERFPICSQTRLDNSNSTRVRFILITVYRTTTTTSVNACNLYRDVIYFHVKISNARRRTYYVIIIIIIITIMTIICSTVFLSARTAQVILKNEIPFCIRVASEIDERRPVRHFRFNVRRGDVIDF